MDGGDRPCSESSSDEAMDDKLETVSSSAHTTDLLNEIAERCADFGLGDSLLEKEAFAAIREVGFAVRMISLPESLPRTADLIFINLITLEAEGETVMKSVQQVFSVSSTEAAKHRGLGGCDNRGCMYCVELTQRGWRVASDRHDCMNGDYRQLDLYTRYFETIYQLLNVISPDFRTQFANQLSNKLNALTNGLVGPKSN